MLLLHRGRAGSGSGCARTYRALMHAGGAGSPLVRWLFLLLDSRFCVAGGLCQCPELTSMQWMFVDSLSGEGSTASRNRERGARYTNSSSQDLRIEKGRMSAAYWRKKFFLSAFLFSFYFFFVMEGSSLDPALIRRVMARVPLQRPGLDSGHNPGKLIALILVSCRAIGSCF
jgi:hypothetical protein